LVKILNEDIFSFQIKLYYLSVVIYGRNNVFLQKNPSFFSQKKLIGQFTLRGILKRLKKAGSSVYFNQFSVIGYNSE